MERPLPPAALWWSAMIAHRTEGPLSGPDGYCVDEETGAHSGLSPLVENTGSGRQECLTRNPKSGGHPSWSQNSKVKVRGPKLLTGEHADLEFSGPRGDFDMQKMDLGPSGPSILE